MRARKVIGNIIVSIAMGLSLFTVPAHAEGVEYDRFGDWTVVYIDAGSSNSCSASTTFTDQTEFQLALVQTPSQVDWAIFLSNAKWNSVLAARGQMILSLLTNKHWRLAFNVTTDAAGEKPVLVSLAPTALIRSIGDAQALFILDDKNAPLTGSLNMKDSERAIAVVERCIRERPLTAAPSPSPSG